MAEGLLRGLPLPQSFLQGHKYASLFPKILLNAHKVHPWVCKFRLTSEETVVLM